MSTCVAQVTPGPRDSPHSAMKMANSTVPSLSKRWVSWREGHVGLGRPSPPPPPGPRPPLPREDLLGPPPRANLGVGAGV